MKKVSLWLDRLCWCANVNGDSSKPKPSASKQHGGDRGKKCPKYLRFSQRKASFSVSVYDRSLHAVLFLPGLFS